VDGAAQGATGRAIADQLRDEILTGVLTPGTRIGQQPIAERFDASRIPVREGLKLLESEGLVTIVPNSGAWVSRLDLAEFVQIYKLREQVESFALQESMGSLELDQVAQLSRLVDEISNSTDVEDFLRLDRKFHLLTYAGARFPLLHELVLRFWNSTQHYRRAWAQARHEERHWATDAEHGLIVDAIKRLDRETAGSLVRAHIRRTRLALTARPDLFA
jgi:DNA-binding GntR family transcriptional regulator